MGKRRSTLWHRALRASLRSPMQFRVGCAILTRAGVSVCAWNKYVGDTATIRCRPDGRRSRHAEVSAVQQIPPHLRRGATVVVVRTRADGTTGCAKPCRDCQRLLDKYAMTVFYSDT